MAWTVDTCLLIDVAVDDPEFFAASARLLETHQNDGLVICPISVVELAPVFAGQLPAVAEFLQRLNISWPETWTLAEAERAFASGHRYVADKRQGKITKRPIADVLIGAFASRFQGLLTRNTADFRPLFPNLNIVAP